MKAGKILLFVLAGLSALMALLLWLPAPALPPQLESNGNPAAIGIIGGADGPTAIYVAGKAPFGLLGRVFRQYIYPALLALRSLALLAAGVLAGRLGRKTGPV